MGGVLAPTLRGSVHTFDGKAGPVKSGISGAGFETDATEAPNGEHGTRCCVQTEELDLMIPKFVAVSRAGDGPRSRVAGGKRTTWMLHWMALVALGCAMALVRAGEPNQSEVNGSVEGDEEKLTIFTAMHSYTYNRAFGTSAYLSPDYVDRPLYWNPHFTNEGAASRKADLMASAGCDVLAQTTFFGFDDNRPVGEGTGARTAVIGRMLKATEGTSLRVAPEVVMMKRAEDAERGRERLVQFLRKLHKEYADHPRTFRKNGKMVVFLWNPFGSAEHFGAPGRDAFGPDDVSEIWSMLGDLREKFYFVDELYYHVRTNRDRLTEKWDSNYIKRLLSVFDNAFYWHSQGNYADEKLWNSLLASDVRRFAPGEPVIVGSRPGYYRSNTGWVNRAHGTGKLLRLWSANQTVNPDWNFFYNWDDYEENGGVIEPTYRNRGIYSEVIKTLTRHWKGLPPDGEPQIWFGSRSIAAHGQHTTTEVTLLRSETPAQSVRLVLESNDGTAVWEQTRTNAEKWAGERIQRYVFSIPTVGLDAEALNPVITLNNSEGDRTVWRGVAPIRLMSHHPMLPMYRFTRLDRLRRPKRIEFETSGFALDETGQAITRGRFRIVSEHPIRNVQLRSSVDVPQPYASEALPFPPDVTIQKRGYNPWYLPLRSDMPGIPEETLHQVEGTFELGSHRLRDARCGLYLFVEYQDGGTWATQTSLRPAGKEVALREIPLLDWKPVSDGPATDLVFDRVRRIPESQELIGKWDLSRVSREENALIGGGQYGWRLHPGYGPNQRRHKGNAENIPETREVDGRRFLRFDGKDDVARLPQRVFPPAVFQLNFRARMRDLPDKPTPLFVANRGLLRLVVRPDGTIVMERLGAKVQTTEQISEGEWFTLRAEDDGSTLRLSAGGNQAASAHEPFKLNAAGVPYADLVVFGGRSGDGFAPLDLARVTIQLPDRGHPEKQ